MDQVNLTALRARFVEVLLAVDPDRAARLEAFVRHDPDLAQVAPEIVAIDLGTGGGVHKDLLDHSARVAAKMPPRLVLRMAALLHDIGKPATRRIEGREVTFRGHEELGAAITIDVLSRLGFDEGTVTRVATIVRLSGRFKQSDAFSDAALRRLRRDAGDTLEDLLVLSELDVTSKHRHKHVAQRDQVARLREALDEVAARDARAAERPVLDGAEVMALLDIGPGPTVGRALAMLLEHQRAHGAPSRDEAVELVLEKFGPEGQAA